MSPGRLAGLGSFMVAGLLALPTVPAGASSEAFVAAFNQIDTLSSTVPANGDLNPYGVAVAPATTGKLVSGNILISNFNNNRNLQGTGSTIVQITPSRSFSLFAAIDPAALPGPCPGGVGLTTALVALQSGWVIVGSLPTSDGTSATMQAGCLLVIDSAGTVRETVSGGAINGPWDMTVLDNGGSAVLFLSNVLNGTLAASPNVVDGGTVVRIPISIPRHGLPSFGAQTVIEQDFPERTDPSALVVGPTGLGLGSDGTLFIADSVGNQIAEIANALTRLTPARETILSANQAIRDPLGLAMAPNGDILTVNGSDGKIVETTAAGDQVATKVLITSPPSKHGPAGAGTLFGLAVVPDGSGVYFVDDGTNTLRLLH